MTKHDAFLRTDFFNTVHIQELRDEPDADALTVTYIFLGFYTDEEGYINDEDVAEIAEDIGFDENTLRDRIERLIECELAEYGHMGFWLLPQEEL